MSTHIDYEINKELCECYLFMGEYAKAGEYYSKAVACDLGRAEPYMGLATIAMQFGKTEEARNYYEIAVGIDGSDKAHTGLGLALLELGLEIEAFGHFNAALKIAPNNMIAMNAMIQLAYKLNRLEETLPLLNAALSVSEDETVRFALAGCLSYLGHEAEARSQLEILLGKNPGNANAQELYARLVA
jgi:tetratricopeptide (TPR) repeat protein